MTEEDIHSSPIFTSEPMATRALAAEIRHDPGGLIALLEEQLEGSIWGSVRTVRCEATERLDIEVEFSVGGRTTTLGIEAKFDHELTQDQIAREQSVSDFLLVVVPDADHVPLWLKTTTGVAVISWSDILNRFPESRLTSADIDSMPLTKSSVERRLRALDVVTNPPAGYTVEVHRGGGGMPAIVIRSEAFPDSREIRAQIQVAGRGMPTGDDPIRMEYTIGISVRNDAVEYPDPAIDPEPPGWVPALRFLNDEVLRGREDELLVSRRGPGRVLKGPGVHKQALARLHLADAPWLAKGYSDGWALGIKSKKVGLDQLEELASITVEILNHWRDVEARRQASSNGAHTNQSTLSEPSVAGGPAGD